MYYSISRQRDARYLITKNKYLALLSSNTQCLIICSDDMVIIRDLHIRINSLNGDGGFIRT